jgi:hypothetical protein
MLVWPHMPGENILFALETVGRDIAHSYVVCAEAVLSQGGCCGMGGASVPVMSEGGSRVGVGVMLRHW